MNTQILFPALWCVMTAVASAVELPADWKNIQQVQVGQPGLVKLALPAETLDAARAGLEDLRIYDAAGHEVPYLIDRPMPAARIVRAAKSFRVSLAQETTAIIIETGLTQPLDGVTVQTTFPSFIKAVQVEGSTDQSTWKMLAQGQPIFRQPHGPLQLRVSFPAGVWPYLRLTVDDHRAEPVPFTGVEVHAAAPEPTPAESLPVKIVERTESPGQTRLTLDLAASHQTLAALIVDTAEPLFMRQVALAIREYSENAVHERVLAQGTIYRVAVDGAPASADLSLELERQIPSREALLIVENHDSPPMAIAGVRAQRRPVLAVFLAKESGSYSVLTGNGRCAAPRYDVAALASQLKSVAVTPLALAGLAPNPSYRPSETLPELQDIGSAIDTARWKYRKALTLTRAGIQQLELDLEVLAHADAGQRDLRLVRDGKQRPYILERTSILRPLSPQVKPANDPKRPSLSRWVIKLPQRSLPVQRLTCLTPAPIFKRQFNLSEEIADDRGETYRQPLGDVTWVRTAGAATVPLVLSLSRPPSTDTLILETDNGDNPAIDLENFQAYYPATRILFKAPVEPATFLYYGNRETDFPRYDIDLVAGQLLAAEKATATLADEEQLKKSSWGESLERSRTTSVIFWSALAVVVIVLLVVISRLLPKTPSGTGVE